MKINNLYFKNIIILFCLLGLSSCVQTPIKTDQPTTEETPENIELSLLSEEAEIAYFNNDLEKSAEAYEILTQKIPQEALFWFRLANIYVRTNRPQEAVELYREALIRDPKFSKAWYNLSIIQLKQTAFNLQEMLIYTDQNDPLYEQGQQLLEQVDAIIKEN